MMSIQDQIPKLPTQQEEASVATWRALGREFGLQHIVGFCITVAIAVIGWIGLSGWWIISRDGEKSTADAVRDVKISTMQADVSDLKNSYAGMKSDVADLKTSAHFQGSDITEIKAYMKDMRDQIQSWRNLKGN
jgi:hypothetical protein